MAERGGWARRWWAIAAALLLVEGPLLADGPVACIVSAEALYNALLEPSLADDGRISPEERQAILATARKLLDESQLAELQRRLTTLGEPGRVSAGRTPGANATGLATGRTPGANATGLATASADAPRLAETTDAPPAPDHSPFTTHHAPLTTTNSPWLENLSVFAGLDGSKQPQDLGINANFGGRAEVNWGFPLFERWNLGGQVGTSLNYSESAVHVLDQIEGTGDRWQSFTTVGLFQRIDGGLRWALAHDFLAERYYDHFDLGQWRGQVGYAVRPADEVGIWFAVRDRGDRGVVLDTAVDVEPINQLHFYWQHTWPTGAQMTTWVGLAEGHGEVVFVFPEDTVQNTVFAFGAQLLVPLSERLALFGAANFLTPNDTGTVDAYLGIAFYPGGAYGASQRRFAPVLPVANNPFFSVDLRR